MGTKLRPKKKKKNVYMNPANLRKGYTNTKEKQPVPKAPSKKYHKDIITNKKIIKLPRRKSTYT